jgi:predicted dehydrogenase
MAKARSKPLVNGGDLSMPKQDTYQRAKKVLAGGVTASMRIHPYLDRPVYVTHGDGPYVWDEEGNKLLDFNNSNGATMLGHNYRRVPAIEHARRLVAAGHLGTIRQVRCVYLQDWLVDPEAPLSWRLDKARAGSGALGDIGAHAVDLAQHIVGDSVREVSGQVETFVKERPVAAASSGLSATAGSERGPVTVDDAATFLARFRGGAMGVFEATRFATGRKNAIRLEVNGSKGSVAFDFEDMNVLHFHDATLPDEEGGFRRIVVTESSHPWVGAWWPPGHGLGYEHGFTHQVVDLVEAIAAGTDPAPTFADGLQVQRVLAAVETSSDTRSWQEIPA